MIYLDSDALVKLIHPEPGSAELARWLLDNVDQFRVSSVLVEIEVPRAIRRLVPSLLPKVPPVLGALARFEIDGNVRTVAGSFPQRTLRSLDAVHLATALELGDELQGFVTYDRRLLAAAADVGLPTVSPGQE